MAAKTAFEFPSAGLDFTRLPPDSELTSLSLEHFLWTTCKHKCFLGPFER